MKNGEVTSSRCSGFDGSTGSRMRESKVRPSPDEVLQRITEVPGLQSLAIVDGQVDDAVLEPLTRMGRINSVEFRYTPLTDRQGDLIAKVPIRVSLNLMGTGISAQKVESMKAELPGLQIDHRQGGFLGVTCIDGFDVCEISGVLPKQCSRRGRIDQRGRDRACR